MGTEIVAKDGGARCCHGVKWRVIVFGQVLSILIAATGAFTQALSLRGVNIPTSQSVLLYVLLSLFVVQRLAVEGRFTPRIALWRYALVALIDVEANYLVVKAYTAGASITSVMLLDCFTIPCVMVLSRVFLRTRYHAVHGVGVAICIAGLACLVVSDHLADNNASAGNSLLGDAYCLMGAALYAVSNVCQEALVKTHDRFEFLGFLGVFGTLFSAVQLAIFERAELAGIAWTPDTACLLGGFVVSMFCMYTLTSAFMIEADATLFNLSLLTSDLYAVVLGTFLFDVRLNPLYFGAAACVVLGILLYNQRMPVHAVLGDGGGDGGGGGGGGGAGGGGGGGGGVLDGARAGGSRSTAGGLLDEGPERSLLVTGRGTSSEALG